MSSTGVHNDEVPLLSLELVYALCGYDGRVSLCVAAKKRYLCLCGILLQLVEGACNADQVKLSEDEVPFAKELWALHHACNILLLCILAQHRSCTFRRSSSRPVAAACGSHIDPLTATTNDARKVQLTGKCRHKYDTH